MSLERLTLHLQKRAYSWRSDSYRLRHCKYGVLVEGSPGDEPIDLPLEFIPRVGEIDLDRILDGDASGVLGFIGAWGPLKVHWNRFALLADKEDLRTHLQNEGLPSDWIESRRVPKGAKKDDDYLAEFRLGAGYLQAMLSCVRELSNKRFSPKRLAEVWPIHHIPDDPPSDRSLAQSFLATTLTSGLGSQSLSVGADAAPYLSPPQTLYGICCLELLQVYLRGLLYKSCANCGRVFSRQEGRPRRHTDEPTTHRADAIFCSYSCAHAKAQREYRNRKRGENAK